MTGLHRPPGILSHDCTINCPNRDQTTQYFVEIQAGAAIIYSYQFTTTQKPDSIAPHKRFSPLLQVLIKQPSKDSDK